MTISVSCRHNPISVNVSEVIRCVTWLQVEMSWPPLRNSSTLSMFPARAALRKLVLLSDCEESRAQIQLASGV